MMSSDAIALLESDHREIERLFARTKASDADLSAVAVTIAEALSIHTEVEEKILYPAARERAHATSNVALEKLTEEARREHRIVKGMLQRLSSARGQTQALRQILWRLEKTVLVHVLEEERLLFPLARRAFEANELRRLGEEMTGIKMHRPAA
jgi:iron-sulfur cluster repair protein YtfE (RIC family)